MLYLDWANSADKARLKARIGSDAIALNVISKTVTTTGEQITKSKDVM
jgi:hypothetical protein